VTEVERCKLEEVNDEGNLREDKFSTDPEHDVRKVKDVKENEMWSNTACSLHPDLITGKQMPDITYLTNKHPNPVNAHHGMVDAEWSWMCPRLPKGGVSMMVVIVWRSMVMRGMIGVVDCGDE